MWNHALSLLKKTLAYTKHRQHPTSTNARSYKLKEHYDLKEEGDMQLEHET